MAKWADHVITHVGYNRDRTRIASVKRWTHYDSPPNSKLIDESIITRQDVIDRTSRRESFVTAYLNGSIYYEGARVEVYTADSGEQFIRTVGNETPGDNLGKLPEL